MDVYQVLRDIHKSLTDDCSIAEQDKHICPGMKSAALRIK